VSSDIHEFGDFQLNLSDQRLLRNGVCVPMPPRVFDTLVLLVTAKGQLVDKDYLVRQLWPDTFVEEGALAHNISILRKALGESAVSSTFIQTVPKRGYRFLAPIRTGPDRPRSPPMFRAPQSPVRSSTLARLRRRPTADMIGCGGGSCGAPSPLAASHCSR